MISFLIICLMAVSASAQTSLDTHRWYLNPDGQEVLISIDDLHDETITALPSLKWGRDIIPSLVFKKDITIAVIDGGIDIDHPELKDHIAYNADECFHGTTIPPQDSEDKDGNGYKGDCAGWNFVKGNNRPEDEEGHGTHVSGIVRSILDGVKGKFKFLPLKTFAPGEGRNSVQAIDPLPVRLTKAFEYAVSRKVDIIHLSVGWPKSFMSFELETSIKKAIDSGIVVVAAAGNSSQRATIFPCQMEKVICVGALRANGDVARFSNWGSQVDIFAPGEKILSTIPFRIAPMYITRKGYDFKNGTSQAAPFITAAFAALKAVNTEDSTDALYSRLMLSASAPVKSSGLKGMFHLDKALTIPESSFVFPELKGLHAVVLDSERTFSFKLSIKNYWKASAPQATRIQCSETKLESDTWSLKSLEEGEKTEIQVLGQVLSEVNEISCQLAIGNHSVPIKLKVQHKLNSPYRTSVAKQDQLLVSNTRMGGRSRLMTISSLRGTLPAPLYYVKVKNDLEIWWEEKKIGKFNIPQECNYLRSWQSDMDQDGQNDLIVETMCEQKYLRYQFVNLRLENIYPEAKFKPGLSILNYEDFDLIPRQDGLPPSFRFLNSGFSEPTTTPWDTDSTSRSVHFYEMSAVKKDKDIQYEVKTLEKPERWIKPLGLRYLPDYQVLHQVKNKILVRIGMKTAWIDVATQEASWAGLDDMILLGSKRQDVLGSDDYVFQSLLTPYEYRGYILGSKVKIRFKQEDQFDPLIDVLSTQKNTLGYKAVLRTFQKLLYIQYDSAGKLLSLTHSNVDRFDFLSAQELIASVINLSNADRVIQLVDGTKINTNYVDVITDEGFKSYEIPFHCVTQNPVIMEGKTTLPVFCGRSKDEFEMRFIEI